MELAPGFSPGHFVPAWALYGLNRLDKAEGIAQDVLGDPKLATAHLLLTHIHIRRSDYSKGLVKLDAYLKVEPDGSLSKQIRRFQESLKRQLTGSVVIKRRHKSNR